MTEEQIQKLSKDKAIEAGYIQSDKEYFETTHWTQHNIYKEGVVEGYKTAMLQGKGEWTSDAVEFKNWCDEEVWELEMSEERHFTTNKLYQMFKKINSTPPETVTK